MSYTVVIWHVSRSTQLRNILKVLSYNHPLPWSQGLNTKQVHQDMEDTFGEDTPSYSLVKKWAGEFKRGRDSLEDAPPPVQEDCTMSDFVHLSIFKVQNVSNC